MVLVLFKFLRTLLPFLKEGFFGKTPIPEIIYKHRIVSFFAITTVFFLSIFILFLDVSFTLVKEKDELKHLADVKETRVRYLENEIEIAKRNNESEFYLRTINRLEGEVARLDKENDRYRKIISDYEKDR